MTYYRSRAREGYKVRHAPTGCAFTITDSRLTMEEKLQWALAWLDRANQGLVEPAKRRLAPQPALPDFVSVCKNRYRVHVPGATCRSFQKLSEAVVYLEWCKSPVGEEPYKLQIPENISFDEYKSQYIVKLKGYKRRAFQDMADSVKYRDMCLSKPKQAHRSAEERGLPTYVTWLPKLQKFQVQVRLGRNELCKHRDFKDLQEALEYREECMARKGAYKY